MIDCTRMGGRPRISRRGAVAGALVAAASRAMAQAPAPQPPAAPAQAPRFTHEDVVRRARDLASRPYDANIPALPDALAKLDFDSWRDIRFRPDRALLNGEQ